MKKSLLLLGLMFLTAQPAFSQGGCPLGGCPVAQPMRQAVQPVYQQPAYQQPVYQQPVYQQPVYQQPVYQQAAPVYMPMQQAAQGINPYYPQRAMYFSANPQCFTGAAACCPQPRSAWRVFVEDYLGFD